MVIAAEGEVVQRLGWIYKRAGMNDGWPGGGPGAILLLVVNAVFASVIRGGAARHKRCRQKKGGQQPKRGFAILCKPGVPAVISTCLRDSGLNRPPQDLRRR